MLSINMTYINLYFELKEYEELGILIFIDGHIASPWQIVEAHIIKETGTYMRDYEMDSEGGLIIITFHEVHERNYYF